VDNTNQKKLFGTLVLNKFYFPLMTLIIFMSYGCAQYGPNHIKSERSSYNQAIQKTNNEQLILNLVRLKYRDNPLFMEVSNLASQFTIQNKIGLTTKLQAEATGVFTPNSDVYIEERPTISYSPLHGESFVKGVLTAVSLKSVVLLFNSGWSIERIFKLCIQRLNNLKNAPSASGPTPKIAPNTDQFFTAVRFLRAIQIKGGLNINYRVNSGVEELVITILDKYKDTDSVIKFARAINASVGSTNFVFSAPSSNSTQSMEIVTRSLLGIMFYLSQGIEIPNKDILDGKVTLTKKTNGDNFDWKEITGELLNIKYSLTAPGDSEVAIFYRDYWFYINDSDLVSKSTFSLLSQVYSLQAGDN
jgi:hypothetical protein